MGWKKYYWEILKTFGEACYRTWRAEMLSSVLTAVFIYGITRADVDFKTALLGSACTMSLFIIWHFLRAPWLIQERHLERESQWGLWGVLFAVCFFSGWVYAAAWFFTMQPTVNLPRFLPDGRDAEILKLQKRIDDFSVHESPNSLRRRTNQLADEIQRYLEERNQEHPPRIYPDSANPNPDDDRKKAIKIAQDYDHETQNYFGLHFQDRMLGILKEYDTKGVSTGYLIPGVSRGNVYISPVGAPWVDPCQDDLMKFRELAFHIDAQGNLITF
jgi:hypothetical protein